MFDDDEEEELLPLVEFLLEEGQLIQLHSPSQSDMTMDIQPIDTITESTILTKSMNNSWDLGLQEPSLATANGRSIVQVEMVWALVAAISMLSFILWKKRFRKSIKRKNEMINLHVHHIIEIDSVADWLDFQAKTIEQLCPESKNIVTFFNELRDYITKIDEFKLTYEISSNVDKLSQMERALHRIKKKVELFQTSSVKGLQSNKSRTKEKALALLEILFKLDQSLVYLQRLIEFISLSEEVVVASYQRQLQNLQTRNGNVHDIILLKEVLQHFSATSSNAESILLSVSETYENCGMNTRSKTRSNVQFNNSLQATNQDQRSLQIISNNVESTMSNQNYADLWMKIKIQARAVVEHTKKSQREARSKLEMERNNQTHKFLCFLNEIDSQRKSLLDANIKTKNHFHSFSSIAFFVIYAIAALLYVMRGNNCLLRQDLPTCFRRSASSICSKFICSPSSRQPRSGAQSPQPADDPVMSAMQRDIFYTESRVAFYSGQRKTAKHQPHSKVSSGAAWSLLGTTQEWYGWLGNSSTSVLASLRNSHSLPLPSSVAQMLVPSQHTLFTYCKLFMQDTLGVSEAYLNGWLCVSMLVMRLLPGLVAHKLLAMLGLQLIADRASLLVNVMSFWDVLSAMVESFMWPLLLLLLVHVLWYVWQQMRYDVDKSKMELYGGYIVWMLLMGIFAWTFASTEEQLAVWYVWFTEVLYCMI